MLHSINPTKESVTIRERLAFLSDRLASLDYDTQINEYEYTESQYLNLLAEITK